MKRIKNNNKTHDVVVMLALRASPVRQETEFENIPSDISAIRDIPYHGFSPHVYVWLLSEQSALLWACCEIPKLSEAAG